MDLQHASELARAPVRAAVRRRLPCLVENPRLHGRRQHRRRLTAVTRAEAVEPIGEESFPPAIDVIAETRHRGLDRRVRRAIGEHQNHARAPRIFRADFETAEATFEFSPFIGGQGQRHMARQRTSTYFSEYKPLELPELTYQPHQFHVRLTVSHKSHIQSCLSDDLQRAPNGAVDPRRLVAMELQWFEVPGIIGVHEYRSAADRSDGIACGTLEAESAGRVQLLSVYKEMAMSALNRVSGHVERERALAR